MFVALVVCRFDVALVDGSAHAQFPRVDEGKPCLGIMGPVEGDDVLFTIKRVDESAGEKNSRL